VRRLARFGLPAGIRRWALLASVLIGWGFPLWGTIWTRSTNLIKIPRGIKLPLPNATYSTRDWNLSIFSIEVKEDPSPSADSVAPKWLFTYKNSDHENHYVLITVQCEDVGRKHKTHFSYTATLLPDQKEAPIEIFSRTRNDDWRSSIFARVTIDFLSTPTG
jgi:hypothetical protein